MQDTGGSDRVSTGTKTAASGALIDIGNTDNIINTGGVYSIIKAILETGSTAPTLSLALSTNKVNGITPLRGSYRKTTLFI